MSETLWGVLIGGLVAIFSSFVTFILTGYIKVIGRTKVFFNPFYRADIEKFDCKIEIINTSNVFQLYRDINMILVKDNKMTPYFQAVSLEKYRGAEFISEKSYANDGNYTVMIPANSCKTIRCLFTLDQTAYYGYDFILLRYFNSRDEEVFMKICDSEGFESLKYKWTKLKVFKIKQK